LPETPLEVAKRASQPTCFSELLAIDTSKKSRPLLVSSPDIRKYVSGHPQALGGIEVGKQRWLSPPRQGLGQFELQVRKVIAIQACSTQPFLKEENLDLTAGCP